MNGPIHTLSVPAELKKPGRSRDQSRGTRRERSAALGANDVGLTIAGADYAALLSRLKTLYPKLLAYAVTPLDGSDLINKQIRAAAEADAVPFVETPVPPRSCRCPIPRAADNGP